MKITLFIPSLVGCGAERVLVNLANYLCKKGHDVCILNYCNGPSSYELDALISRRHLFAKEDRLGFFDKVFLHLVPKTYYDLKEKQRLARLKHFIDRNDAQCYLVMLEQSTIDLLSLRKYIHCPIIVSERNYPERYRGEIKQKLYEMAPLADGYVFQTQPAKDCYGKAVRNFVIIPNALNDEFSKREPFDGNRRKAIVTVGRLESQKNQELLIRAFAKADLPEHILEIYGEGPLREKLQELIISLGVADKVFLRGHVDNIGDQICDAELFVLSSDYEGIPNVVLEAMALGLPCITTDFAGGGAHVLIDSGVNGIILPEANASKMAECIKTVLNDPALANRLSTSAMEKAKCFDAEEIYSNWETFIVQTTQNYKH